MSKRSGLRGLVVRVLVALHTPRVAGDPRRPLRERVEEDAQVSTRSNAAGCNPVSTAGLEQQRRVRVQLHD